jgi:hypothetical protein
MHLHLILNSITNFLIIMPILMTSLILSYTSIHEIINPHTFDALKTSIFSHLTDGHNFTVIKPFGI